MTEAFRRAVEARDAAALEAALAADVTFSSPAVFKPYEGREATMNVLRLVMQVFDEFEYTDVTQGEGSECLIFRARVGDRQVQGLDYLRFDGDGLVKELTVMIRPLSGLMALAEAMRAKLAEAGLLEGQPASA